MGSNWILTRHVAGWQIVFSFLGDDQNFIRFEQSDPDAQYWLSAFQGALANLGWTGKMA
jgi:hypothetical protein